MTSMTNTNSPKTPVLSVEDLCVTFRQEGRSAQIVRNVSFSVEPGRCLGILGESGSGKSMSCKAVLRLLDRNFEVTGRITFMGEDLAARSGEEIRRMRGSRITMVLQNPMNCFDPLYRIGEQMAETFREHTDWSASKIREESLSILSQMRIASAEEVLRKYPHQLSGGMLQRVMIGLAIKLRPDLIVCDEPISALDVSIQAQIVNLLIKLQRENDLTYLFISHDLSMVRHISDRVGVMYLGSLVELATSRDIFERQLHPYTKALLSAIPSADPDAEKTRKRVPLEGEVPSPVNPPSGCKFRNRCIHATELCAKEVPVLTEVEPGRFTACHHWKEAMEV